MTRKKQAVSSCGRFASKHVFSAELLNEPRRTLGALVDSEVREVIGNKYWISKLRKPKPVLIVHTERFGFPELSDSFVRTPRPEDRHLGDWIEHEQSPVSRPRGEKLLEPRDERADRTVFSINDDTSAMAPELVRSLLEDLSNVRERSRGIGIVTIAIGENVARGTLKSLVNRVGLPPIRLTHERQRYTPASDRILPGVHAPGVVGENIRGSIVRSAVHNETLDLEISLLREDGIERTREELGLTETRDDNGEFHKRKL
ncbi:MAG TPA: hypothetical protein PK765_03675 [bacterium]|nr:hypothetical protein [bacterium]